MPELTKRTISTEGTASMINSARIQFTTGRRAETGSELQNGREAFDDGWRAMSVSQRTPGADVVDVGVAIDIE